MAISHLIEQALLVGWLLRHMERFGHMAEASGLEVEDNASVDSGCYESLAIYHLDRLSRLMLERVKRRPGALSCSSGKPHVAA